MAITQSRLTLLSVSLCDILAFLLFPVVLGLWDGAVTECLLNELQSPVNFILRTDVRL